MLEALVTIHDTDLIRSCEEEGRFAALPHTYLFVGPRPLDDCPPDVEVFVARAWPGNYERFPQFYDFTGWWAVAKYLTRPARWLTVQYDHQLRDFDAICRVEEVLARGSGPVAFVAGHRLDNNWMLMLAGFEDAFNAGMAAVDVNPGDFGDFNEWPTTQGMAWRSEDLAEFMAWFEPLFEVWADNVWAGHLAERSVWAWMMATGRFPYYGSGLVHEGRDCHGTCSLMGGNADLYAARAATFGR